jgi:hypothetical protein
MFAKSKITFVAAAIATAVASPALAQSTDHTGTLFPSYYNGDGKQTFGSWLTPGKATIQQQAPQGRGIYNSTVTPKTRKIGS